ncbi:MAG: hemolysin III family protein [Acholeplasmataceae bacterium]|nr:hemolysin III family protein [Acholeplasmataceae bacterium]
MNTNNTITSNENKKRFQRRPKTQSLGEEIANSISHGVSALLGIVGLILLLIKSKTVEEYVGSTIFGVSMILLYTSSCMYHAFKNESTVKAVFKRFDHVSIYLLIGGTFAPIFLVALPSPLKWIMLGAQWAIIITGIVLKAVKVHKYQTLHITLFLLLGWSGVFFINRLFLFSHLAFWFILAGGLSYSIGVIFYALRPFKYSHFIWHFFVMGGTIFQFFAIYFYLIG